MVPDPKNRTRNAHVKFFLGKEFGNADLAYVDAPMYYKKACARISVFIPIARPSEALSECFIGRSDAVDSVDLRLPLVSAPPPPIKQWPPAQRYHVEAVLAAGGSPIARAKARDSHGRCRHHETKTLRRVVYK